jgi:hypothetical protein
MKARVRLGALPAIAFVGTTASRRYAADTTDLPTSPAALDCCSGFYAPLNGSGPVQLALQLGPGGILR